MLFGVLFLLPPILKPLDANAIFGWRTIITVPVALTMLAITRHWDQFLATLKRLRQRPVLIPVLILNAGLLGIQMWLFGWAPQVGRGLQASLGYLLLPLMMVVVGVLFFHEHLTPIRTLAVASAAVGVLVSIVVGGAFSWVTLVIAIGWPVCFASRRVSDLQGIGALVLEFAVLLPVAIWFVVRGDSLAQITQRPSLIPGVIALGIVGGVALSLYLTASQMLPFGLFGLLTYLEPLLLVVVSVALLGEHLTAADAFVYGPILLALVLLAYGSFHQFVRARRLTDRHRPG